MCGDDVRTGGGVWCVVMTSERVEVCGVVYCVAVTFRIVRSSPKTFVCDCDV